MATQATSTNGVYLVSADGDRIPLKRSLLEAVKRMIENKGTGEVTLHFRTGGHAHTSDKRIYQDQ